MNECDFCLTESEYLIPVNDGLWAICSTCNDYVHLRMEAVNQVVKVPCVCDGGSIRRSGCCKIGGDEEPTGSKPLAPGEGGEEE